MNEDLFPGGKVVIDPSGEAKMSEVLQAFAEPYLALADSDEATRRVYALAALGWNASFYDGEEQREMVDDILSKSLPGASRRDKSDFRKIVAELVQRKKAHFSDENRMIVNYRLTDMGDSFHLIVASTPGRAPEE